MKIGGSQAGRKHPISITHSDNLSGNTISSFIRVVHSLGMLSEGKVRSWKFLIMLICSALNRSENKAKARPWPERAEPELGYWNFQAFSLASKVQCSMRQHSYILIDRTKLYRLRVNWLHFETWCAYVTCLVMNFLPYMHTLNSISSYISLHFMSIQYNILIYIKI